MSEDEPRTLSITAHILNSWEACPRKVEFGEILMRGRAERSESIERGLFFHKLLAVYYRNKMEGLLDQQQNVEGVIEWGRREVIDSPLSIEASEECFFQLREYSSFYLNERWKPIAVEAPFSRVIYKDDKLTILHEGRVDLAVEDPNFPILPVDHKTEEKEWRTIPLGHQFMGYLDAINDLARQRGLEPMQTFCKNAIGFQKTKPVNERMHREWLNYDLENLVEWRQEAIRIGLEIDEAIQHNLFSPKFSSCWRCIYVPVCRERLEFRRWKLEKEFEVVVPHDPFAEF